MNIEQYLEDLENRIEPEVEDDLLSQWHKFWQNNCPEPVFKPRRKRTSASALVWPTVAINEALENQEFMALQQVAACSNTLANGNGGILCVRANYGSGILPSIFGADVFVMDKQYNTLPTTKPLGGGVDAIQHLLSHGIPDLNHGYGRRTLDCGSYFREILKPYPKLVHYVHTYHPDLQGPIDVCELLLGSNLFLALIDNAELVKQLLALITDTYIAFMRQWWQKAPPRRHGDLSVHWLYLHRGAIMLRNDSLMNLSPAMYVEFARPYDQRLFDELGDGAIHFCGKGDHYIAMMSEMRGLSAIALSQPHLNNMEVIFQNTIDKGIKLLDLGKKATDEALNRGRNLRGHVHCSEI